jgi:hypothetical protein
LEENKWNPLVSIVIPVYNGSNYLREAIDSALAQTYKNCEILVINDGSNDDGETEKIALSYGDKIKYFSKENGGVSTALNIGIKNMRGEYFSWLSHDDLYMPDKIAKNISAVKSNPTCIVYSDYDSIDENGELYGTVSAKQIHRAADYEYGLFPLINGLIHGCSLLIHRRHFEKHGVFDEHLKCTQDYELWFRMFRDQRLIYINESLVKGRVHANQTGVKSDNVISEGEVLWYNMLSSLTKQEICKLGGSERNFWSNEASFLDVNTQYEKAISYTKKRLDESKDALCDSLVSVIMPFYNRIDVVTRSIVSVQQQSYNNWELLLINDGSTEDIEEIEEFTAKDKRIRLIDLKDNVGAAQARNIGIEAATGKFIAFLDSDDLWNHQKLEKQINFMLENDYCVSHTYYNRMQPDETQLNVVELPTIKDDTFRFCLHACGIATPCVIVERDYLGDKRFPNDMDYGEDVCLWLELAWIGKWGLLPEPLTSVRIGETTTSVDVYKSQLGHAEILRYILKNPAWASYQLEIGILVRNLANLCPVQEEPVQEKSVQEEPVQEESYEIVKEEICKVRDFYENSTCWKITKPIRFTGNFLRRLKRGVRRYGIIGVFFEVARRRTRKS